MTFSQRMNLAPVRNVIQVESLDSESRNALWNLIGPFLSDAATIPEVTVHIDIWTKFYHKTYDSVPATRKQGEWNVARTTLYCRYFREQILNGKWNGCMDLVEFMANEKNRERWNAQGVDVFGEHHVYAPSVDEYNEVFSQYFIGYRFVSGVLSRITKESEIAAIESALGSCADAVNEALSKSLLHLSSREKPDYAKSVQCSISAVESQCCILLGDERATLGEALRHLERDGIRLHGALKDAFVKLYGFTSDAGGIRHGSIQPSDVDQDIAKFMLVTCSAFVNYLISKGR